MQGGSAGVSVEATPWESATRVTFKLSTCRVRVATHSNAIERLSKVLTVYAAP